MKESSGGGGWVEGGSIVMEDMNLWEVNLLMWEEQCWWVYNTVDFYLIIILQYNLYSQAKPGMYSCILYYAIQKVNIL